MIYNQMNHKLLIIELQDGQKDLNQYKVRRAARGVISWGNKIALLNVTKCHYHKLPGGGIEKGESNEEAFKREVLEETGSQCRIKDYAGVTIEYREEEKLLQISYVFLAEVIGEPSEVNFEQGERDEGFKLEWIPVENVQEVLSQDKPSNYEGSKFICNRDKAIINFYNERLSGH
jgi:ADP-ribose pyrophosphatase YjhB (NUDIX family)